CSLRARAARVLHAFPTRRSSDLRMVAEDGNPDMAQIMAVLAERDDALATLGEDDLVNVYRNYENGLRQAEEYRPGRFRGDIVFRSEEHTSELQSRENLVCRLLLE